VNSYNTLTKSFPQNTVLSAITQGILQRQQQNSPVHEWTEMNPGEIKDGPHHYCRVDQIMSKELYTVFEEDIIDLVPNIMKWNQVRHMLVENREGDLVGLITLGRLGKYYSEHQNDEPVIVKQVMINKVISVRPDTRTLDAINLMQEKRIGCLPVLNRHHKLVGVITEKDLLPVAASYLKIEKDQ
jgi:CBS domain-containing protein